MPTPKETGFFSMLGSRAIWHKGWKAVSVHPTIAGWGDFDRDRWELYDTDEDPTESHDLAAEHPEKLQELINALVPRGGPVQRLPAPGQDRGGGARRPDAAAGRAAARPLRLLAGRGGGARGRGGQHPQPQLRASRSRSTIDSEDAAGVLFSHGARFGGHALYVKDRKLKYVYNFVGDQRADRRVDRRDPDSGT